MCLTAFKATFENSSSAASTFGVTFTLASINTSLVAFGIASVATSTSVAEAKQTWYFSTIRTIWLVITVQA